MEFDDIEEIDPDLQERLSSWRTVNGAVTHATGQRGEGSFNEAHVRTRQKRIAAMCLNTVRAHDAFYTDLKALVDEPGRETHHQQRVQAEAAFALGVFEQSTGLELQMGIQHELNNLPKEVVQTVYIEPPPPPPKSWFQRLLKS